MEGVPIVVPKANTAPRSHRSRDPFAAVSVCSGGGEVSVSTLELFFDLVLVVVIHNIAASIETGPLPARAVGVFILRVFCSWTLWHGIVVVLNVWLARSAARRRSAAAAGTPRLAQQTALALVMCCFAFMASATAQDDNVLFLSLYLAAYAVVLGAGAHRGGVVGRRPVFYLYTACTTYFMLVPATVLAHKGYHTAAVGLWGGWAGLTVISRLCVGWMWDAAAARDAADADAESIASSPNARAGGILDGGHVAERYELLVLILLGEVVGDSALSVPGASTAEVYWIAASCIATGLFAWKLYFDALPHGFVTTNVSAFRNMILLKCHFAMACALAALGAGYARGIEALSASSGEGEEGTAVAARLATASTGVFLMACGGRVATGVDPARLVPKAPPLTRGAAVILVGAAVLAAGVSANDAVSLAAWCGVLLACIVLCIALEALLQQDYHAPWYAFICPCAAGREETYFEFETDDI